MTICIDTQACDGCAAELEPPCVRDCPGDLLRIDRRGKAAIVDARACWDCAACVKVCPTQAISLQLGLQLHEVTLKAQALACKTIWSIRLPDGLTRTYETPGPGCPPFAPNL
jgi:adenylylsulfate reductase subunit B